MINRFIGMGRLTADPELRQTQSGISVVRFTIAIDRPYQKDKEKQTDFIRCTAWRDTAEFVNKYFAKGKMIIVEGAMHNNDYTDNNGVKHFGMDALIDKVTFGETKKQTEQNPLIDAHNASANELSSVDMNDFEEILSNEDMPF